MLYLYGSLIFCLGVYSGLVVDATVKPEFYIIFLIFLSGLAGMLLLKQQACNKVQLVAVLIIVLAVSGLAIGMIGGSSKMEYAKLYEQNVCVTGNIVPSSVHKNANGDLNLLLELKTLEHKDKSVPAKGYLRLYISSGAKSLLAENIYGYLKVVGKLQPIIGMKNPGVIDSEKVAYVNNIVGRMVVKKEAIVYQKIGKPMSAYFVEVANLMRETIAKCMPENESAVLSGMALGGYEGIPDETVRAFSATGIIHILSVSGSHIALLIGFIFAVGKTLKIGKEATLFGAAVTIILYGLLCGFSPPVLRSVLMGCAMLTGTFLERESNRGAILATVIILMLCYKPRWLLDIGFILSFASTAGLLFLFAPLQKQLAAFCPIVLADGIGVTLAAQLAALPFIIYYFHQISIGSLIANLLIVPVLEFIVLLTLCGVGLSFLPVIGSVLLLLSSCLLAPTLSFVQFLAKWYWTVLAVPATSIFTGMLYYGIIILLFGLPIGIAVSSKTRKIVIGILVIVLSATFGVSKAMPGAFTAYFIDVGQGDAALIMTPEKKTILVDTGGVNGEFDIGERVLLPFLRYLNVTKIDLLVLSHGHHDHAGGAAAVGRSVAINTIILANEEPSEDVSKLLQVTSGKSRIIRAATGQVYQLGSAQLTIITAPSNLDETATANNESSIICKVSCENQAIVFTGDATLNEEQASYNKPIKAAILKVAHHGSKTSSNEAFLQAVDPRLAIISVGRGNRFGHPAQETLDKLQRQNIKVLRTDLLGNIKIVFDDRKCTWYSYRYQENCF